MGKIVPYRDNDNNNNIHNNQLAASAPVHTRALPRALSGSENKENVPVYAGTSRSANHHHQKPYSRLNTNQSPLLKSSVRVNPIIGTDIAIGRSSAATALRSRIPLSAKPTIGSSTIDSISISASSTLGTAVTTGHSIFEPAQKLSTEFVYTQSELATQGASPEGNHGDDSNANSRSGFSLRASPINGSPMRKMPVNGMEPSVASFSPSKPSLSLSTPSRSMPTSLTVNNQGYRNSNGTKKKMVFMR